MSQLKETLAKIVMALLSVIGGVFCGAMIIYFLTTIISLVVYGGVPVRNTYECAQGNAIGYFSILSGGLLGTILGCITARNYLRSFTRESIDNCVNPAPDNSRDSSGSHNPPESLE